ncbi:flagellar export protein FliJ [Paracidovorax wautersii]|uniref:Flagellar FliJ protein n=1 Tax=Paracidovorax wautersii TaxID=1177982 RepID=A0A1I2HGZ6_9BURK|nr:flagellar export protein FliJ [Paracidovorax wautersii]SFF28929.1 flagellar FliJ protein [Paracidovorax wautersii]
MSSLQAFLVAVEMAERQRDAARQALQDIRRTRHAAQQQFDQLQGYAEEIQDRWGAREDMVVKPEVMHHQYQFMDRLGQAIGMQNGVLDEQAGRVHAAEQRLLQAELRLASLKKVVDKRRRELEQLQARREQKQTDERAAIQAARADRRPMGEEE